MSGKLPENFGNCPVDFREIADIVREISWIFPGRFQDIPGKFTGHFQKSSRKNPGNFRELSGKFPEHVR